MDGLTRATGAHRAPAVGAPALRVRCGAVLLFQGDRDALTAPEPARRFFEDVTAPVKDFALIEDASHFASFRHPERFLELMLGKVRPVLGK
ncbi:hypothetical protein [Streptomyces sp. NPDC051636]|uniref:hypothetical protein n=1 Tax=Streptomyces sp. NPDC051636 TaxID=3365663 RepID=UPI0037909E3E